jgi:putative ABC transport system substrate-binding protein
VRRRRFLVSALAAGALPAVAVRAAAKAFRIGWVTTNTQGFTKPFLDAVTAGLVERGYTPGSDLIIEPRDANDVLERIPQIVHELDASGVDLIVTQATATRPVVASAGRVPVVFVFSGDPVEAKLTESVARPTGNCTGISLMAVELNAKRLELVRDINPNLKRAAIVASPAHPGENLEWANTSEAAARMGVELAYFPVLSTVELEASFAPLTSARPEAILALPDPVTTGNRNRIVEVATGMNIPVVSGWSLFAHSGALCTYGPKLTASYQRAAYFVDRILKGVKPGDLPIERPSVLELVINLKTAAALGLTLPQTVLGRADEIIE